MKKTNNNLHETEKAFISFKTAFNPETATLLLNIDNKSPNLELKKAEAEKLGLSEKEEFHFTIIGSRTGEEILKLLEKLSEVEKNTKLDEIQKLYESADFKISLQNVFYYIQKEYNDTDPDNSEQTLNEKRQSIVQISEITGLNDFYQKLNLLLGTDFDASFPHLTLYTTSTRKDKILRGIGIYSENQFHELNSKKI